LDPNHQVFTIKSNVWAGLRAQLEMVGLGDKFVTADKECEHSGWLLARNKVEALGWNRRYVRLYQDTLRRFQMIVYRDSTASIVKAQINLGKFGVNTVTAQRKYSMDMRHYRFRLVPVDVTATDADMNAKANIEKNLSGIEVDDAHEGTSLNQLHIDFATTDEGTRSEWLQAINKVQSAILEQQQTQIRMERAATRNEGSLVGGRNTITNTGTLLSPRGNPTLLAPNRPGGGSVRSSTRSQGSVHSVRSVGSTTAGVPSAAAKILGLAAADAGGAWGSSDEDGEEDSGQQVQQQALAMAYNFAPISCDIFIKHATFGFLKCGRCGVARMQHFKYSEVGVSLSEFGVPELQGSLAVLKPPKGAFGKDKHQQLQVLNLNAASSWKLRYVQLRGTKLAWYRTEEAGSSAASAGDTNWSLQFDLETKIAPIAYKHSKGGGHGKHRQGHDRQRYYCFVVRSQLRGGQNGRSEVPTIFAAHSEEERQQWLDAFVKVQQFCYTVQEERIRAAADEVAASAGDLNALFVNHLKREPQLDGDKEGSEGGVGGEGGEGGDGDGEGEEGVGSGAEMNELLEMEHKSRYVIQVLTQRALPPPYLDEEMSEETMASLWNPETSPLALMLQKLQKASPDDIVRAAPRVLQKLGVLLRRLNIALTRLPAVAWQTVLEQSHDDETTTRQQQHMQLEREKLELQVSLGIGCVHTLMDTDVGLRAMLRDGGDVLAYTAALCFRTSADATVVVQACQMCFAACVYSHDGYQLVLFILDLMATASSLGNDDYFHQYDVDDGGGSLHQKHLLGPPLPLFDVLDFDPEVVERAGQNGARFEILSKLLNFSLNRECAWRMAGVVVGSAVVELESILVSDDVCLSRSRRLMYRCEMEKAGVYTAIEELEDRLTERMMDIDDKIEAMDPEEHDMSSLLDRRATIIDEAYAEEEASMLGDDMHQVEDDSDDSEEDAVDELDGPKEDAQPENERKRGRSSYFPSRGRGKGTQAEAERKHTVAERKHTVRNSLALSKGATHSQSTSKLRLQGVHARDHHGSVVGAGGLVGLQRGSGVRGSGVSDAGSDTSGRGSTVVSRIFGGHHNDGHESAPKKAGSWGTGWMKRKTDGGGLGAIVEGSEMSEKERERVRRDAARAKERAKKEAAAGAAAADPLAQLQQELSGLEQLSGLIEQFLVDGEADEEDDKLFWSQAMANGTDMGGSVNWQVECHRLERALLLAPGDVQASLVPVLADLNAEVGTATHFSSFGVGLEEDMEMGLIKTLEAIRNGTYAPAVEGTYVRTVDQHSVMDEIGTVGGGSMLASAGIAPAASPADVAANSDSSADGMAAGVADVCATAAEPGTNVGADAPDGAAAADVDADTALRSDSSVVSELLADRGGILGKRAEGATPSEGAVEAMAQLDQLAEGDLGAALVGDGAGGEHAGKGEGDGVDGSVLNDLLAAEGRAAAAETRAEAPPSTESGNDAASDPKFAKYAMMKKMHLPEGAIRGRMMQDGLSVLDQELFFAGGSGARKSEGPAPVVQLGPQPIVKMRALYWEKLDEAAMANAWWNEPDAKGALGEELAQGKKIQGRMEELQQLFGGGIAPTNTASAALTAATTAKANDQAPESVTATPGRVTLLEPRRANNIGITLARLKMSGPEIVECLLTLDEKRLDLNTLELVQLLLPEEEEVKALKKYEREHPECLQAVAMARQQHRQEQVIEEQKERELQKKREEEEQREEQEEKERQMQQAVLPGKHKKKDKKTKHKKDKTDDGWVVSRITQAKSIQLDDDMDRSSFGSFSLDEKEAFNDRESVLERARALSAKEKVDMAAFYKLRKTEQTLMVLHHVPQLGEKLACIELRLTAEERLRSLSNQCRSLSDACSQLCESNTLKGYMALVCQVGNFLNWGTSRGGAKGITLAALEKLASVKSKAPGGAAAKVQNYTLLHYTAHLAQGSDEDSPAIELRKLPAELSKLPGAVELDLQGLAVEVRELRQGLTMLEKQAQFSPVEAAAAGAAEEESEEDGLEKEEKKQQEQLWEFASAMRATAAAVEVKLAAAAVDHEKALERMGAMLRYFGEDAAKVDAVSWMKRLLVRIYTQLHHCLQNFVFTVLSSVGIRTLSREDRGGESPTGNCSFQAAANA
jgi:hypothetical protein